MQVLRHLVQNLRKRGQRLDAGIPRGLGIGAGGDLLRRCAPLHVKPLIGGRHLCRVGGPRQNHGHEIIGVESDRGDHLLEVIGAKSLCRLIGLGKPLSGVVVALLLLRVSLLRAIGRRLLVLWRLLILRLLLVLRLAVLWILRVLAWCRPGLVCGPVRDGGGLLRDRVITGGAKANECHCRDCDADPGESRHRLDVGTFRSVWR